MHQLHKCQQRFNIMYNLSYKPIWNYLDQGPYQKTSILFKMLDAQYGSQKLLLFIFMAHNIMPTLHSV